MAILHSVRSYRKHHSITQSELARLLGLTQTRISRLEKKAEPATIEAAFALQVIFGIQPNLVFRSLYETVQQAVVARAGDLERKLEGRTGERARRKRELIADILLRVQRPLDGL
jgi:transcriptional regulator with XRE-family HTH domain